MKDGTGGKIITKFATTAPKTYNYRVQNDGHQIEDSEFVKTKTLKKSAFKEVTFHIFDKCVHDISNIAVISYNNSNKSYNNKNYTITCNKIALCHSNENDT